MIQQHLEESKHLILKLSEKILLNKQDEAADKRMFAPLFTKTENTILSEYLIDLANERLEDLKTFTSDAEVISNYKNELTNFLRETIKQKL